MTRFASTPRLLVTLTLLSSALTACAIPPRVESVTLARNVDAATYAAVDPVMTFNRADKTWHAVVAVSNLEKNSSLTALWYRGEKPLAEPQRLDVPDGGGGNLDFSLEFPGHQSGGEYRVDIYLGDMEK